MEMDMHGKNKQQLRREITKEQQWLQVLWEIPLPDCPFAQPVARANASQCCPNTLPGRSQRSASAIARQARSPRSQHIASNS